MLPQAKLSCRGCDAWMVQVPARMRVAVFPETGANNRSEVKQKLTGKSRGWLSQSD